MDGKVHEATRPNEEPGSSSPIGNCLRASFTADNYESLGDDITRSLLHLSREAKAPSMRARLVRGALPLADEVQGG